MNTSVKCWILMFCFVVFPLAQLNAQTAKAPPKMPGKELITYNNPTKWMIIYLDLDTETAQKVNEINSKYLNQSDSIRVNISDKVVRVDNYNNIQESRLVELQEVLSKAHYEKLKALFEEYKTPRVDTPVKQ